MIIAQSSDRSGWMSARAGKFTASTFGDLVVDDSGRLKNKVQVEDVTFGSTAITLIRKVAMQRITGLEQSGVNSAQTERGEQLEEVALAVLNRYWQPLTRSAFIEVNSFAGASPDFVTNEGEATGDIKCPWNAEKFMEFIRINDNDHEAMRAYDHKYYWQIMMQAFCAGVSTAYLALFDDRQPLLEIDAAWLAEETGYTIPSGKCAWVVRRFDVTQDVTERIKKTLAAAEYLCQQYEEEYRQQFKPKLVDEQLQKRIDALLDYGCERAYATNGTPMLVLEAIERIEIPIERLAMMSEEEYKVILDKGLTKILQPIFDYKP